MSDVDDLRDWLQEHGKEVLPEFERIIVERDAALARGDSAERERDQLLAITGPTFAAGVDWMALAKRRGKALKEIAKGEGPYSRDRLTHAENTIEAMKALAVAALADEPEGVARPRIVCLCGSTRFVAGMAILGWLLEKEGAIVLGLHLLPAWYEGVSPDHQAEAEGIKEKMDALHLRKIDLADQVFIYNKGGYIGESTRRELNYARSLGKVVTFLEPEGGSDADSQT